ncbi:cytoplasmic protein [bacterium 1XD21-13]|nr:cytoplasmic protein [bacterium 1XD21-13]
MAKKVLLAGESWMSHTTHVKGFDTFFTSVYETGEQYLKAAMERGGYDFTFLPNHLAMEEFPFTMEELKAYDLIILSDIGANTLLLPTATFTRSEMKPNRCNLIRDYVLQGGSLLMVGGYMTFSGVDAKGKWQDTAVQEVLPVTVLPVDDRMEHCEGVRPVTVKEHPVLAGLGEWPRVLGYNKTVLKEDGELLATVEGDPFIALGTYGEGRSAVFTTDCAPHWAPPEFCEWEGYDMLFQNLAKWLTKEI